MVYVQDGAGTFVVRYFTSSDLMPDKQAALVEEVRQSAAVRKTGIVFVLHPDITWVDTSVPAYWLKVTGSVALTAAAVVTRSAVVGVAVSAFRLANVVRGTKIAVEQFVDETAARSWMKRATGAMA